jgi:hypothetical protein
MDQHNHVTDSNTTLPLVSSGGSPSDCRDSLCSPTGTTVKLEDRLEDIQAPLDPHEQMDLHGIETFRDAGKVIEMTVPYFQQVLRGINPHHPFLDNDQFEVAKWLHELPLPKAESFFQLELVRK